MLRQSAVRLLHVACVLAWGGAIFAQQPAAPAAGVRIPLRVEAGTPLRLYIVNRVSYKKDAPVTAKLIEPVWSFDRIVIPAGTTLEGKVAEVDPVSKTERAMSIIRGDFTPLKRAKVSFARMVLPSGQAMMLDTQPSLGLASIYVPPKPPANKKNQQPTPSANKNVAQAKAFIKQQAQGQIYARTYGVLDLVRGPNKREWLENFFWTKMPYHPQWYRSRTRFDAVLNDPIDFGSAGIPQENLAKVFTQPAADQIAPVRLLTALSSSDAKVGDPVKGVMSQPLFSHEGQLILPEGTDVKGKVTMVRHARMFHRCGQLRFAFEEVEPPAALAAVTSVTSTQKTQAQLTKAEMQSGPVNVDEEGTAKATESKTRFLRPAIAGLVAARTLDNDPGKEQTAGHANYSARGLGGFSGFGLLGSAAPLGPRFVGTALGFYGLAWSVYTTVVSRGMEVTFERNTATAIRFTPPRQRQGNPSQPVSSRGNSEPPVSQAAARP